MNKVRRRLSNIIGMASAILVLAAPALLRAQATGTISGYVRDASGAVVPEARVTATHVQHGTVYPANSDAEGFYNFPALDPGEYTITVEKEGFQRTVQSGLALSVGQNLRVDAALTVGTVTQEVSVTAAAPLVDTTSGTVSGLVDDRRIVDLPLDGRNIMSLAEIVPGVVNVKAPESLSDARSGPMMNTNGGRQNMNLYTFDGSFFNNPSRNTGMNYPPPDAIQEFRLLTSNFDAEYGRNAGSEAMVVSRAGTNALHGDVWEFVRNDALNARNFFADKVPAIKENQFGGAIGGPIKKDKAYFFGSFQDLINHPQGVANQTIVPTASERTGNFTDLLPGVVLSNPTNPNTGVAYTTPSGAPCVANNIIDPSCITTPSQNFLKYVPTSPTGTVASLGSSPVNDKMFLGRIDLNLSSKQSIFGHVFVDHNAGSSAFGSGSNLAGYNSAVTPVETVSIALNDTYTFRPNLVNQVVVAFLRTSSTFHETRTDVPTSEGINMPQYAPNGTTDLSVSGSFSLQGSGFNLFKNNNLQFRDELTWIHGRHEIKAGGEVLKMHFLQRFIGTPGFSFNGQESNDPFADYLLGAFSTLNISFGLTSNDDVTTAMSFFVQDRFKVTPRFTLTYGLRWEPNLFWYDKQNRIDSIKYGAQSKVVPDAPPGFVFPGDPGVPRTIVPAEWLALAPRLGFAWDVFGNGKTSVRGGYGVFFNQINADSEAQQNAPYSGVDGLFNGNWTDPFTSTGTTAPPTVLSGKFGCVPIATAPGVNCPLFPLPAFGFFLDGNLRTPYTEAWNLGIQRQLTPATMLEVSYIGNMGLKLNNLRNFNPARFVPGTFFDTTTGSENTVSNPSNVNSRALFDPGIVSAASWTLGNDFRSWYHSFQVQMTHRMNHGLSVTSSYTLAKTIDMCSAICEACGCVSNPFNLRSIRGRANFDRRHAFVASYLWSPPVKFSDRWKNELLGGWSFSGITTIQSGSPMTFTTSGLDVAVDGTYAPQHAFPNGQAIPISHPSRNAMVSKFFNTNAFVDPTCSYDSTQTIEGQNCTPFNINYNMLGTFGALGRNILSGPAISRTDFAVLKDIPVTERYKFQFRSEFFNVFNQVSFNNPDTGTLDGGAFGTIQSASPGRVVQFGMKFFW